MKIISPGALMCALALTTCVAAEERAVSKQVTVKAPVEAVWNAWTTTEGVKSFFAPDARIEARAQRTVVIVRLKPVGEGETQVSMAHLGWGDGGQWDQAYAYSDKAWEQVLGNLQKRFVSGPIDWTDWLARMKAYGEKK